MFIRKYSPEDCPLLAKLFYQTVHHVNAGDYDRRQLDAWADGNIDIEKWNASFLKNFTRIAVKNSIIVGFGDIDKEGYLDRLYVHKDHQKEGIGNALCQELEKACGTDRITTHSSITAKPFFEKRGYRLVSEQQVERRGIKLTNFIMEKRIR